MTKARTVRVRAFAVVTYRSLTTRPPYGTSALTNARIRA